MPTHCRYSPNLFSTLIQSGDSIVKPLSANATLQSPSREPTSKYQHHRRAEAHNVANIRLGLKGRRRRRLPTTSKANTNNAYYKFTGATIGSVFNVNQGQISFYLTSRYSFAQRQANPASPRYAFDVRDAAATNHLFYFQTQPSSGYLFFTYAAGGTPQYYVPTPGTEDTLFGNGVTLKVTLSWDGAVTKLYLNDALVKSSPYTKATPNWTAASNFNLGAYEYLTSGGYYISDDVIDEFTVTPLQ